MAILSGNPLHCSSFLSPASYLYKYRGGSKITRTTSGISRVPKLKIGESIYSLQRRKLHVTNYHRSENPPNKINHNSQSIQLASANSRTFTKDELTEKKKNPSKKKVQPWPVVRLSKYSTGDPVVVRCSKFSFVR